MLVRLDGQMVYAATGGRPLDARKPPLLFIHGAGQDHTSWQQPARYFAWHGHCVLAVDLPGHGRSDGPALASVPAAARFLGRLLDALSLDAVAIVGHSMGSAIALEAAAAFPARVRQLALLGAGIALPVNAALLAAARDRPEAAIAMIVGWGHGPRARLGGNAAPGLWMTGAAAALLARAPPGVLATDLAACSAWTSGREAAARVRCPALVVIGARDAMAPPAAGEELVSQLAAGRSVRIDACGHMLMAEAPEATLNALIAFFAKPAAQADEVAP
jgi:pimeloyl-ACP methyl ester carboxylesterase